MPGQPRLAPVAPATPEPANALPVSVILTTEPISSAAAWPGHLLRVEEKLRLDSGGALGPFTIAYQTYGRLDEARSNAVLVCHALTGDQYVAENHPLTGKPGWWETMVGPGLVL